MATNWIKLHDDLHEDPRVFRMGQLLAKTADHYITRSQARDLLGDVTQCVTRDALRDITIAGLARVWRAANRHTTDGTFKHASLDYLDTLAQIPGFGTAMEAVGWAKELPDGTLTLPNFLEHNEPDKNGKRAKTHAERQAEYRERQRMKALPDPPAGDIPTPVTSDAQNVTPNVTRDGKSDAFPSISKSHSISESKSESEPEIQNETTDLAVLDYSKARLNRLRGSWAKLPHWSAEEEAALFAALPNLRAMEPQDWAILAFWLRWAHSKANNESRDPVRVTSRRHAFVTDLAANLDRATAYWKQCGCPRLNPDGTKAGPPVSKSPSPPVSDAPALPPAQNAAAFIGLLKANGAQLPPKVATQPAAA